MKKNWIGAIIGGQQPQAVQESERPRTALSRVLGEAAPLPEPAEMESPDVPDAPEAPEAAAPGDDVEPAMPADTSVQSLLSAWESGSKINVAQTLLNGISSYTELVGLLYGIGQEGALELARMMDELSSDEPEGGAETDDLPPAEELEGEPPATPPQDMPSARAQWARHDRENPPIER